MKIKETIVEVNLKNLTHNLNFLKSKLNSKTLMMAVVKAFSYGADSLIIAKELEKQEIDYLAVAYTNEGLMLRKKGIDAPILVLHPQIDDFNKIIEYNLEPSIYSFRILNAFMSCSKFKNSYPFQIKFNTGLNRLGFHENEINNLISSLNGLIPTYIFSHLGASEDKNEDEFSNDQIKRFASLAKDFQNKIGVEIKRHILNTSGILNFSKYQYEMVRTGIGLYGFGNDPKYKNNLKPVISLKTIISQIHKILKGDSVGYNKGFIAKDDVTIATLPIGHADGISRQYGNGNGSVMVNGKFAPIIGNVCMDMLMINISKISCKEGDQVIIFDDKNLSADDFTKSIGTIPYEILASLSKRIKRVVIS